jgi:two-component system chemotaxis response regulator CheY
MSLRILIVDDSDVTRRILSTIVRSGQWTVCAEAEDGAGAIEKFSELLPDLVLLDLAMPDMNGIVVARVIHAIDPTVPIILISALDLEGIETQAQNAGICAIVPKGECWNLLTTIEQAATLSAPIH